MNIYGLIGKPLIHSFSKKYFEEKFLKEKIANCFFELFPLNDITEFTALLASKPELKGLAVTIPYKEAVMPFLHEIDPEAMRIGAVNCITIFNYHSKGYNTDAIGFEKSLLPLLKPFHQKALVLGTGGASKAILYILKKTGIPYLNVSRKISPASGTIDYAAINEEIVSEHKLIINCTPVGMYPNDDQMPRLPYHFLTDEHLLYDLVYKPPLTRFLSIGESYGATIKNGYEMLLLQAEENWKIWKNGGKD